MGEKVKNKTFYCLNCNSINPWDRTTKNKYCSNVCQAKFKWRTETVPRIERGECSSNSSKTLVKYLHFTRGSKCEECGLGVTWNNKPLTLQLDHIDGNSDNNDVSNLRLLCPNCHTQTDTHGSKGTGNTVRKETLRNQYFRNRRR